MSLICINNINAILIYSNYMISDIVNTGALVKYLIVEWFQHNIFLQYKGLLFPTILLTIVPPFVLFLVPSHKVL